MDGIIGLANTRRDNFRLEIFGKPIDLPKQIPPANNTPHIEVLLFGKIFTSNAMDYASEAQTLNGPIEADTIIRLYNKLGEGFLKLLDGEFALALYDRKKNTLIIAVDPLGIKPLYYHYTSNQLAFCTSISKLHLITEVPREFNYHAAYDCFTFGTAPDEATLFNNINRLSGGTYAVLKNNRFQVHTYFCLKKTTMGPENKPSSTEECQNILVSSLRNSISSKSADTSKMGISLSGGVDSGILGFFLTQAKKKFSPIHIDLRSFKYPKAEQKHLLAVGNRINSPIQKIRPKFDHPSNDLENILFSMEDFAFHPAIYAYYTLYRHSAASGLNTILSGDGLDELFLGYDYLPVVYKIISSDKMESMFRLYSSYGIQKNVISRMYANYLGHEHIFTSNHFYFSNIEKGKLFPKRTQPATERYISNYLKGFENTDLMDQFTIGELRFKLKQTVTTINNLASFFDIDNRFPFLSKRLIQLALGIPVEHKLKNGIAKYPIKQFASSVFGRQFAFRKKTGIYFSISFLMQKNLKSLLGKILRDNSLIRENYLSSEYLSHYFRRIQITGNLIPRDEFLLFFFLWYNFHFENKELLNYV